MLAQAVTVMWCKASNTRERVLTKQRETMPAKKRHNSNGNDDEFDDENELYDFVPLFSGIFFSLFFLLQLFICST